MNITIPKQIISAGSGREISVTKFSSEKKNKKTIVISSATGVLQKYYRKFASHFASIGYTVYTFDYWGIGESGGTVKQLKNNNSTLKEWGSIDQAAVTFLANENNPNNELILLTHSIGGQIVGFNGNYHMIDKLIFVASQSGYWGLFGGFNKTKMLLFWYLLLPVPTNLFGYFPAKKMGLFENLPKKMSLEWGKWGKKKDYLMHFYNVEDYFFKKIKAPILALSFPKDGYAPKKAADWLPKQYGSETIERIHYTPAKEDINKLKHFGFFREHFKSSLWKKTEEWIKSN